MNKNTINENPGEIVTIYKMAFIYNAIINGWSVKYLDNNKFEFINKYNKSYRRNKR